MKNCYLFIFMLCLVFSCSEKTKKELKPSDGYDVVILNGRVMDPETNFDGIRNVGIKDGRIISITEAEISGKEIIDARGHVVAPGFIDYEQHGLDPFGIKVNLRDGVTTQMDFEVGALNIPEWYEKRSGKFLPLSVSILACI
ncbi:MAG: hypothetical protein KC469_01880, partial [Flavobacteriaceae bacterium]|nr:hypothetical protein [Flavobacteriaceae bacterium]